MQQKRARQQEAELFTPAEERAEQPPAAAAESVKKVPGRTPKKR
jgi:hypothetical protein